MAERQLPELTNQLIDGVLLPALPFAPKLEIDSFCIKRCKIDGIGIGLCLLRRPVAQWEVPRRRPYGSEYEGGGVADPRPEMLGDSVRLSIARPSGSLAMLEGGAAVCSPIIVRPKKTSGEVHAATARRIWFVRNERPTWYAAAIRVRPGREETREERGVPFIQPNPSRGTILKSTP
jgi:hypothetical protein